MGWAANHDMFKNFDFEELSRPNQLQVILMLASDGVGSPFEWLCAMMMAAAFPMMAKRNTSWDGREWYPSLQWAPDSGP